MPAASAAAGNVLCQQRAPGRGKGQQPSPHRWPCRSWLGSTEQPLGVAQIRLYALPQHSAQPFIHSAPPSILVEHTFESLAGGPDIAARWGRADQRFAAVVLDDRWSSIVNFPAYQ
jgi:hypothetical protein